MPRLSAAPITLTPEQETDLQGLARAHKTPRKLAERAEMILRSAAGTEVRETARQLGVWPKTVRHWRSRWLAGRHVESRNHRLRAVADVFELPPGDLARLDRQVRGGALQRLHAGHFVDRHRANVLLRRRGRLMIERTDLGAFALELRVRLGREPAAHAMRLEVGLFLKSARPSRARCCRRCRA